MQIRENLMLDPFDFVSLHEKYLLGEDNAELRDFAEHYLMTARDYAEFGAYIEALEVLEACRCEHPMITYYEAYYRSKCGENVEECLIRAESLASDYCFPNKLEDIAVLRFAIENGCKAKATYYLGNLFYDRLQWKEALALWEESVKADDQFPTAFRNLSLVYYNKCNEKEKAKMALERAFALDEKDVRVFLELDQLYKKLGWSFGERLSNYEQYAEMIGERDDLYVEYITLLNAVGRYEEAYSKMMRRKFHPWEGGEGKITKQYTISLLEMAKKAMKQEQYAFAEELLRKALIYPKNLGEGKLEGTKDNHLYYHLGLVYEAMGEPDRAADCFEIATRGTDEPAGAMYYNDQPADMILYQGLSYLKLGKVKEAKSRFYRLIDFGEQHLYDEVKIEYFAVSLPEFMIFDEDYTARNKAHCYYLMALGNLGLGKLIKSKEFFGEAMKIEPSHMMCGIYGGNV